MVATYSAMFEIDQPGGAGPGAPGSARIDLWLATRVNLAPSEPPPGATYQWSMIGPTGSAASFVDPDTGGDGSHVAAPYFVPDVWGSYLIQLSVNNGVYISRLVAAVQYDDTGVQLKRGWRYPVLNESWLDASDPYGWTSALQNIFDDILDNAFGGGGGGDVTLTYILDPNIETTVRNVYPDFATLMAARDTDSRPCVIVVLPMNELHAASDRLRDDSSLPFPVVPMGDYNINGIIEGIAGMTGLLLTDGCVLRNVNKLRKIGIAPLTPSPSLGAGPRTYGTVVPAPDIYVTPPAPLALRRLGAPSGGSTPVPGYVLIVEDSILACPVTVPADMDAQITLSSSSISRYIALDSEFAGNLIINVEGICEIGTNVHITGGAAGGSSGCSVDVYVDSSVVNYHFGHDPSYFNGTYTEHVPSGGGGIPVIPTGLLAGETLLQYQLVGVPPVGEGDTPCIRPIQPNADLTPGTPGTTPYTIGAAYAAYTTSDPVSVLTSGPVFVPNVLWQDGTMPVASLVGSRVWALISLTSEGGVWGGYRAGPASFVDGSYSVPVGILLSVDTVSSLGATVELQLGEPVYVSVD